MSIKRTRRVVLVTAILAWGCRSESSPASEPSTPAEQTYEVRGVVEGVKPDRARVNIAHEAIPEFVDASGAKVGMAAMTMPFAVGPGVALGDVGPGDKVAFTLEVRWKSQPDLYIPKLTKLPADAKLNVD